MSPKIKPLDDGIPDFLQRAKTANVDAEATAEARKARYAEATPESDKATPIAKPSVFDLNKFKSNRPATIAGVETLLTGLPHFRISEARDFVRLHSKEEDYWSGELCFVSVPIKGSRRDTLHLIEESLAMQFLESARIQRFRLALASKPNDVFFLCHVPSQNLDNRYNETNLDGCNQAKKLLGSSYITTRRGCGRVQGDLRPRAGRFS
jgi:hypothetical protein